MFGAETQKSFLKTHSTKLHAVCVAILLTWQPEDSTKQRIYCNVYSCRDCFMFSCSAHLLVAGHHHGLHTATLTVCHSLPTMRQGGLVQPSSLVFFSGPRPLTLVDSCTGVAVGRKRTAGPRSLRGSVCFA